ncbi:MAG: sulfatase-like hydrolase/transferase [Deltaproteobacteria bacterium]|nr:sulfatase-like hydrolase/transferase [Deltaproteobacteria bacterium]
MTRRLLAWTLAGLIAGIVIGLADALVLVLNARNMFFETRELTMTAAWTLGLCAGAGTLGLTVTGMIVEPLCSALPRLGRWGRPPLFFLIVAAILAFPLGFILWQLTAGPQASQIPGRPLLVVAGTGLSSLIGGFAAVRIPSWATGSSTRRRVVLLSTALLAACLYLVDLNVLVRLYPIFHAALTAGAVVAAGVGLRIYLREPRNYLIVTALAIISLGTIVWSGWSLTSLRGSQNPRFVVMEKTTTASDLLALARFVVPLPPEKSLDLMAQKIEYTQPTSQSNTLTRPGADVFLLSIDALRYDRLALLGADRKPAPNLDTLADKSIVFSRAYTPIPHTSYAISSLLTGKYTHSLFDIPGAPNAHETLPEILSRFRYKTAAFFTRAVFFIDRARFEPYIRSSFGFSYRKVDYLVPARERADQLIAYLEEKRNGDSPIFAWAHFFDPHEPYDSKCTRFGNSPVDRYDCEVWNVDQALGRILAYLDKAYPKAIIIVTSDHGEEFEDHGGRFHGTTLYDEQSRVPLVIRVPEVPHRIVDEPVSLVDVAGTLLALLDIPIPARIRSRNLTGLLTGNEQAFNTFAEVHEKAMLVTAKHKLICDDAAGLCRLYDLNADPGEKRSIAGKHPGIVTRMRAKLNAWSRSHARHELRPIESAKGAADWPAAVQAGLAGDENSLPGLIQVLKQENRSEVRLKAARLLRDLWNNGPLMQLDALNSETDPAVAIWLAVLRYEAGQPDAASGLEKHQLKTEPLSDAWRAAAIARLGAGDDTAIEEVLDVAICKHAPIEERLRAIRLLGQSGRKSVVADLLSLINNYQLTLETASALGRIGDKRAVGSLITRLRRERFKERKTAIISALTAIGGRRATRAIEEELASDTPPLAH